MDDDNATTANYQTALVNALRPISDGLAAFHTIRHCRNGVSPSPLACTHCGHHPVSVRSATSRSPSRVHRLKRTCPTCHFVQELDLGTPPAVSRQTKNNRKRKGTKESDDNGNDNGNTAKLNNGIEEQSATGRHVLPAISRPPSMKRTKKLSELQLLLARHRQKKEQQTKKQSEDGKSSLSAFLESL